MGRSRFVGLQYWSFLSYFVLTTVQNVAVSVRIMPERSPIHTRKIPRTKEKCGYTKEFEFSMPCPKVGILHKFPFDLQFFLRVSPKLAGGISENNLT